MEPPELITLIPEEESEEEETPSSQELGRQIVVQLIAVVLLKVATGIVINRLAKNIRQMDILYPEHLNRIRWKDFA